MTKYSEGYKDGVLIALTQAQTYLHSYELFNAEDKNVLLVLGMLDYDLQKIKARLYSEANKNV